MASMLIGRSVRASRPSLPVLLSRHCCCGLLQSSSLQQSRFISYGTKVFVGGLSQNTTERQLIDAFSSFGEVIDARIVRDDQSGKSKGFAFIRFVATSHANSAMRTMNGRALNGKVLRVGLATEKADTPERPFGISRYSDGGDYSSDRY
ncbi:hypothetical protein KP509_06G037800 [Ceratopteris richardii]|uniref:RRM domain-containing protein n=1 Tax=Ceratopteris richardii TaxID=49495 RepID=A0A8T2UF36_CERRI|nr:hypothetical protein KP509_06G037800 [Ceratopteris richardii]